jgi:hypothetical protein
MIPRRDRSECTSISPSNAAVHRGRDSEYIYAQLPGIGARRRGLAQLPGGQNLGFVYAADGDYLRLNERFTFGPGVGLSPPNATDSYAAYWSGWQYLWTEEAIDAPINTLNGRPDLKGIGLFARAGFGDDETLPIE